jgi:hypothetical protein
MSLIVMQRDFRAWLETASREAAERIEPGAAAGLLVYQNNYRAQLMGFMRVTFERVHAWLGDEAFDAAAARHILGHPPHSWTLDAYGADFPATLAALYPNDPEIAELAWIDRALADAFVAPDVVALTNADIADADWDDATLAFTPSLAIGIATSNAAAIWSALSASETPPAAEYFTQSAAILVWRQDYVSCFRSIEASERRAIERAREGMSFGALCALLVESLGDDEGIALAGTFLGQWLRDGLIVGLG